MIRWPRCSRTIGCASGGGGHKQCNAIQEQERIRSTMDHPTVVSELRKRWPTLDIKEVRRRESFQVLLEVEGNLCPEPLSSHDGDCVDASTVDHFSQWIKDTLKAPDIHLQCGGIVDDNGFAVDQMQSVWITLSDGTKAGFSGKAVVFEGDVRTIRDILFTKPKPLPPDHTFEAMD
jgi:hypothetical protein